MAFLIQAPKGRNLKASTKEFNECLFSQKSGFLATRSVEIAKSTSDTLETRSLIELKVYVLLILCVNAPKMAHVHFPGEVGEGY